MDWRAKYAEVVTRKLYSISTSIKLNPHEPAGVTRDVIAND